MTPLVLIAGFLGAGKTTLLRGLLPGFRAAGLVPHVILNDYRNAAIDAATLDVDPDLVAPIAGTCICCGSQAELMAALRDAPLTADSVLLLEANGTSDTTEIIEILTVDRRARRYTRPVQVTVIDATRWQARGRHDALERLQAQTARYLLPTRLDDLDPPRRAHVLASVRSMAPRGVVTDPDQLLRSLIDLHAGSGRLPPRRFDRRAPESADASRRSASDRGGLAAHRTQHHFSSVEIPIPQPVDEAAFREVLRGLPDEVVRVKGITRLADVSDLVYFERTDRPDSVALFPIPRAGALDSVAVLIGVGLDGGALDVAFRSLW